MSMLYVGTDLFTSIMLYSTVPNYVSPPSTICKYIILRTFPSNWGFNQSINLYWCWYWSGAMQMFVWNRKIKLNYIKFMINPLLLCEKQTVEFLTAATVRDDLNFHSLHASSLPEQGWYFLSSLCIWKKMTNYNPVWSFTCLVRLL